MYFLVGFLLFVPFVAFAHPPPTVLVNELSASNASVLKDEAGEYDDFIELHNPGNTEVNVSGMFLSDRLKKSKKWKVPDHSPELTTIPPGGFLLIWCDEDSAQGLLHANFKLDRDGESLYLFAADGKTLVDSVKFPKQYLDFSYGRLAQGKEWSYFIKPSPWTANGGNAKITAACPSPSFATRNGFYKNSVSIEITVPQECNVFYSTNGKEPEQEGFPSYVSSFEITKTTVVRARSFREGFLPSEVVTSTYFINENVTVPVASVVTDPLNLWNGKEGIYTNPFEDMEKPANFEYFTQEGKSAVNMLTSLKIFGNTSRNSSKQSFSVVAKEKFGQHRIQFAFFQDKPKVKSVDGIILRGDVTSGRGGGDRETAGERVKNELMYHLIKESGSHVDAQAYQPVVLFINGSYWGLYNLMEKKGKDFIRNNHGADKVDIIYGDELDVIEGDSLHYIKMLEYIAEKDLTVDSLFEPLYSVLDMESLMDYWIFEIYSATHDYKVNIRMWRPRTTDGKWRWIAFDEDSWGKVGEQSLDDFTGEEYPETIYILGAMLQNEKFKIRFINRMADLLNTVLLPQNVHRLIDEIQFVIKDEKERDYNRWKNLVNFVPPGSQIASLKEFAEKRPDTLRYEMVRRFELQSMTTLLLDVKGNGKIHLNTIVLPSFPWSGIYFEGIPITATAVPEKGYRFKYWQTDNFKKEEATLSVTLPHSEFNLTAVFEKESPDD